jgi:hypothetical protein
MQLHVLKRENLDFLLFGTSDPANRKNEGREGGRVWVIHSTASSRKPEPSFTKKAKRVQYLF